MPLALLHPVVQLRFVSGHAFRHAASASASMRLQALGSDFHHRLPSTEYNGAHVMALASSTKDNTRYTPGIDVAHPPCS